MEAEMSREDVCCAGVRALACWGSTERGVGASHSFPAFRDGVCRWQSPRFPRLLSLIEEELREPANTGSVAVAVGLAVERHVPDQVMFKLVLER